MQRMQSTESFDQVLTESVSQQNINFQLNFEIQRLNDSLKNITQLMALQPAPDQSQVSGKSQLDPQVSDKLSQSIGLFSNVMGHVSQQRDFESI